MATDALSWRAPDTLPIDTFFKRTKARNWGDVTLFMKRSRDQDDVQGYHNQYHRDLDIISGNKITPDAVVKRAQELKDAKNLHCFKKSYNKFVLKMARHDAVTSLQGGQYALTKDAGQRIKDDAECNVETNAEAITMRLLSPEHLVPIDGTGGVLQRLPKRSAAVDEDIEDDPEHESKRTKEGSIDSEDSNVEENKDPIDRLLTSSNKPMGSVVNTATWLFDAMEGDLDVGTKFSEYYKKCSESTFKAKYPHDALALNATMLLTESPSPLQVQCFGMEFLDVLMKKLKSRVPVADVKDERILIREWTDHLIDHGDREATLSSLEDIKVEFNLKPLKRYLTYAVSEFQQEQETNYREADGVAAFVLPLLRKFFHAPDGARLAYTNCASTASIYHRRLLDLTTKTCGQPDITTRTFQEVELFFGEASGVLCKDILKQAGDVIRLGVFGKNALDQVDDVLDTFTTITQAHVIGSKGTLYMQFPLGKMYMMVEIGTFRIPDSLNTLPQLAQDIACLMKGSAIFKRELERLSNMSVQTGRSKKHFPSIVTPNAKMALL
ncbi:hypothetical protein BG011_008017 [Mortierella polycephala]|uniref:Uncharacterized protein n=1 Tax=Mortierella polycephala TaxID=41804 RepID=A0A9P6U872_9FUNG|nr:hypothetical protein BG011_008017 [Mortierella polycephala]